MAVFDVSLGAAFGAGVLSFASPCVLPLVPAYLCFLGGVSLDRLNERGTAAFDPNVAASAAAFVVGFAAVFVALGASASAIGTLLAGNMRWLSLAAGGAIIVLGIHYCGLVRLPLLDGDKRVHVAQRPAGLLGAFLVGLAFAFGWTPCVGPVLATILMIAARRDSVADGTLLLAAYAAGLGVPFLAAAVATRPFLAWTRRFRRHLRLVELSIGGLLIATGALVLTGGLADVANWLGGALPALAKAG
ncbi:MAG: cytochrome c biogenesis protein CcdA [Magnetospirillum sp.]|nr:cytochrome c biogenesis protein CcdA [Magnetospirillum sp.]